MVVPPVVGPLFGMTTLTTGLTKASYVKLSEPLVPTELVTLRATAPAAPPGLVTPMALSPKVKKQFVCGGCGQAGMLVEPNVTVVALLNPLPNSDTLVPPPCEPWVGPMASSCGAVGVS